MVEGLTVSDRKHPLAFSSVIVEASHCRAIEASLLCIHVPFIF